MIRASPDDCYKTAVEQWGASLERLATACEADSEKRRDLIQRILLFPDGRRGDTIRTDCSNTAVYVSIYHYHLFYLSISLNSFADVRSENVDFAREIGLAWCAVSHSAVVTPSPRPPAWQCRT